MSASPEPRVQERTRSCWSTIRPRTWFPWRPRWTVSDRIWSSPNSGMEALRHLLEDDFAAILLDVKMPEMDGFQTAELIRVPQAFAPHADPVSHRLQERRASVPGLRSRSGGFSVQADRAGNPALQGRRLRGAQPEHGAAPAPGRSSGQSRTEVPSLLEAAPDAMIISSEDGRDQPGQFASGESFSGSGGRNSSAGRFERWFRSGACLSGVDGLRPKS